MIFYFLKEEIRNKTKYHLNFDKINHKKLGNRYGNRNDNW